MRTGHIYMTLAASKTMEVADKKFLVAQAGYRGTGTEIQHEEWAYLHYICPNLDTIQAIIDRLKPGTFYMRIDKVWEVPKEIDRSF